MVKLFLLLALGLAHQSAWAFQLFLQKPVEAIHFNLGSHTEFYQGIQTDDSGGQRNFDFAPTVGAGVWMPLTWTGFSFLPEFNWVLPQTNENSRIIKNVLMIRADIAYDFWNWLRLRLGTSVMWLNQHGRGGSAKVDNGNTQSTFYYPDENRSSWNNTIDLGVEALLGDKYSLRFQTYAYAYFNEERRQTSYTVFFSYYWDR